MSSTGWLFVDDPKEVREADVSAIAALADHVLGPLAAPFPGL
ncbi:hypothetical protein [Streptomyces mirabilis]